MSLLSLPDHCLHSVLQFLTDDLASLFSAARAHSRLHHAAAPVLSSIRAHITPQQKDSLLLYISNHRQHINSIAVTAFGVDLDNLPADLSINSLSLEGARVQLHASNGCQGVLASSPALQTLQLRGCEVMEGAAGLAAALPLLHGLQQLEVVRCRQSARQGFLEFPGAILQDMQRLTSLNLAVCLGEPQHHSDCVVHHLHHLTNLEQLQLTAVSSAMHMMLTPSKVVLTAELLSGLTQLSYIQLSLLAVEPAILAGKPHLQHVALNRVHLSTEGRTSSAASTAALLSELQLLHELTHLCLADSLIGLASSVAAYSTMTASSKLEHLDISGCTFPPGGIWDHVIPTGMQLRHMRVLNISHACISISGAPLFRAYEAALDVSDVKRLVACCPNLEKLIADNVLEPAKVLQPLTGLTALHTLVVSNQGGDGLAVLKQLSSLKRLEILGYDNLFTDRGLLQLTALRQLTHLQAVGGSKGMLQFKNKVRCQCQARTGSCNAWRI